MLIVLLEYVVVIIVAMRKGRGRSWLERCLHSCWEGGTCVAWTEFEDGLGVCVGMWSR